jgi:hypothetical protein
MDGSTGDGDLDRSVAATGKEIVEAGKSTGRRVDDHRFFFDVFLPPPWLLVFGAGDDAIPLVEIAAQASWTIGPVSCPCVVFPTPSDSSTPVPTTT